MCSECMHSKRRHHVPLLKQVVSSSDNLIFYPFLVFPYSSLIESLRSFFVRPGFYEQCDEWRQNLMQNHSLHDFYDGKIWKSFYNGESFQEKSNCLGFMLNVDWF